MLDLKLLRTIPEKINQNCLARRVNVDVAALVELDKKVQAQLKQVETHRALRNRLSEDISKVPHDQRAALIAEATKIKEELVGYEAQLKSMEAELVAKFVAVPNLLADDVPPGTGDDDHVELAVWLPKTGYLPKNKLGIGAHSNQYMPSKAFNMLDHIQLGKNLDIIDIEQSAVVSGSRFCYLKNEAVLLQDALAALLKQKLHLEKFIPMMVPLLVKERVLFGTSHFPEGRDQVYKIETDYVENNGDLFLVGSSEPPLFAFYMDKTIKSQELPIKMYALTSCFRSEVGSWGKDVKGIKRVHQFDKLEMDIICHPSKSYEVMDYLRSINEWLFQTLELPYRIIYKCAGDCGYNATHKQYDQELWLPGQHEFIEIGSNTNTTDYQARRMNIRYTESSQSSYVHTVNDTGIPFGRMLIALLENYQQEDGSVIVPEALRPYMYGIDVLKPK